MEHGGTMVSFFDTKALKKWVLLIPALIPAPFLPIILTYDFNFKFRLWVIVANYLRFFTKRNTFYGAENDAKERHNPQLGWCLHFCR